MLLTNKDKEINPVEIQLVQIDPPLVIDTAIAPANLMPGDTLDYRHEVYP